MKSFGGCTSQPVNFLSGSLPLVATLHLRQLTMLGMIARFGPGNPLFDHGRFVLNNVKENSFSWFCMIRHTCTQYALPTPLEIMESPPTQSSFKSLITSRVIDFWENKLRESAANLPSLLYFKAAFYSLAKPHPIWYTAGNNPYEVEKAMIQARLISGCY